MKNKKWNEFGKLTEKCYANMIGAEKNFACWGEAFEVLKEIVADGREQRTDYALELYQLDEMTDYEYDVQGWLEDYLDELEMHEAYEELLAACNTLLDMFQWKEENASDIIFRKVVVLGALGKNNEAAELAANWLNEEPDNIAAISVSIYANIAIQNMEAAEKLVKQHIQPDTKCTEENDIIFIAASTYYQVIGNEKEKARIDKAIEEYEEYMEEILSEYDEDDIFLGEDEDLPFN